MRKRYFRTQGGQWLDAVLGADGEFAVPLERHVQNIEEGYGLTGLSCAEVDDGTDPRSGTVLSGPTAPPSTSRETEEQRLRRLIREEMAKERTP